MKNLRVTVNGVPYEVQIEEINPQPRPTLVKTNDNAGNNQSAPSINPTQNNRTANNTGAKGVVAPMPGVIKQIKVAPDQTVQAGDIILVLEAMKLENEIKAKTGGTVKEILVEQGQIVGQGTLLVAIE